MKYEIIICPTLGADMLLLPGREEEGWGREWELLLRKGNFQQI